MITTATGVGAAPSPDTFAPTTSRSDGTATLEECFGPGSDLNGNGIADVNE